MRVEYDEQMDIWTAFWGGYAATGDTEAAAREWVTNIVMRGGPPEGWTICVNGGEEDPDNRHWIRPDECGRSNQVSIMRDGVFWYVSQSGWCPRCEKFSGRGGTKDGRAVNVAGACEAALSALVDPGLPQACERGECLELGSCGDKELDDIFAPSRERQEDARPRDAFWPVVEGLAVPVRESRSLDGKGTLYFNIVPFEAEYEGVKVFGGGMHNGAVEINICIEGRPARTFQIDPRDAIPLLVEKCLKEQP